METFNPKILIVDDDRDFVAALSEYAQLSGCEASGAFSAEQARQATEAQSFDLVLVDLDLPDANGLELISELDLASCGQIAVVTGNPSARSAARALQLPVLDYIEKPVDGDKLRALLERAARAFDQRVPQMRHDADAACGPMLGNSPVMRGIFGNIRRVAPFDVSVLICGESGTGKDLAARAIHEHSRRRGRMVAVNCGAVTAELLGSQLFGHEKGSFTGALRQHQGCFEQAEGGTIFLDEITEMPASLQVHLLRVLENRTITRIGSTDELAIDVRVIAATNRDPRQAIAEGRLREDLYYRLIDFPLALPPLRERGEDLLLLARHFLQRLNTHYRTQKQFAPDWEAKLLRHAWPGNIRELKHVVQRSFILASELLEIDLHTESPPPAPAASAVPGDGTISFRVGMSFAEVEQAMLEATLHHYGDDKAKAAAVLGVSVKTIYNRLSRKPPQV